MLEIDELRDLESSVLQCPQHDLATERAKACWLTGLTPEVRKCHGTQMEGN